MVADGYKQTDVGMIPEDWNVKTLGQFGLFSKGKGVKKDEAQSGELACIRYGELYTKHNDYVKKVYSFISQKIANTAKKLKNGDILFAGSGETKEDIGKSVAFIGNDETYAGGDIVILSPKNVDSLFLGYALNIPIVSKQKASKGQGDAVVHISANSLSDVKISIPNTKQEQQAIATALSDTDELINSLEKLIAKKEAIKTGTMQELLTGKKRLDGFSGEWEEKLIGEFTNGTAGGTPSTKVSSYWGGNIRWMSSGELNYKVIHDVEGRITEEGLNNSSTKIIPENCILIGLAGQGKTRGTVAINRVELCTNQSIAAIYPSDKYISEYLYYNMDSRYEELRAMSTGDGGRGGLNLTILRNFRVPFPSKEEQHAIATILSDMDADIDMFKTKLSKVKAIKEGMMQELLTGKTRLLKGATDEHP